MHNNLINNRFIADLFSALTDQTLQSCSLSTLRPGGTAVHEQLCDYLRFATPARDSIFVRKGEREFKRAIQEVNHNCKKNLKLESITKSLGAKRYRFEKDSQPGGCVYRHPSFHGASTQAELASIKPISQTQSAGNNNNGNNGNNGNGNNNFNNNNSGNNGNNYNNGYNNYNHNSYNNGNNGNNNGHNSGSSGGSGGSSSNSTLGGSNGGNNNGGNPSAGGGACSGGRPQQDEAEKGDASGGRFASVSSDHFRLASMQEAVDGAAALLQEVMDGPQHSTVRKESARKLLLLVSPRYRTASYYGTSTAAMVEVGRAAHADGVASGAAAGSAPAADGVAGAAAGGGPVN